MAKKCVVLAQPFTCNMYDTKKGFHPYKLMLIVGCKCLIMFLYFVTFIDKHSSMKEEPHMSTKRTASEAFTSEG